MCETTVSKKKCYSSVIALFSFLLFFLWELNLSSLVFSTNHGQLLLRSLVIKGKNVFSSKITFKKRYWISKKNKNKNVTCVIRWFNIIFSFPLSFIYTSFMTVGSCNFPSPENLKCVRQQGLIWYNWNQIWCKPNIFPITT